MLHAGSPTLPASLPISRLGRPTPDCKFAHGSGRVPARRRGEVARRVLVEAPAGAVRAVARRVGPHRGRAAVLQPLVCKLQTPLPRRRLAVLRSLRVPEEMRELVCAYTCTHGQRRGGNRRMWSKGCASRSSTQGAVFGRPERDELWECRVGECAEPSPFRSYPEPPGARPPRRRSRRADLGHTQPKVWGGYFDPMLRCDCRKRGSSAAHACGRSGAGVGRRCPRAGRGWSCAWLCGLDSLCGACGGSSLIRLSRIYRGYVVLVVITDP